ncbi:hypothetical protein LINGRAHAP2_LOCUS32166 [Linum grandiflorum]
MVVETPLMISSLLRDSSSRAFLPVNYDSSTFKLL